MLREHGLVQAPRGDTQSVDALIRGRLKAGRRQEKQCKAGGISASSGFFPAGASASSRIHPDLPTPQRLTSRRPCAPSWRTTLPVQATSRDDGSRCTSGPRLCSTSGTGSLLCASNSASSSVPCTPQTPYMSHHRGLVRLSWRFRRFQDHGARLC